MRRKIAVGTLLILAALSAQSQQPSTRREVYKSPDGSLVAVVEFAHQPEATSESEVLLQTPSGKVFARRDYRSEDGEHGFGVTKAQWTPDSQFFVYSLDNSGGHRTSPSTRATYAWRRLSRALHPRHCDLLPTASVPRTSVLPCADSSTYTFPFPLSREDKIILSCARI